MTSLHPPARRVDEIELQPDWILLGYPQDDGTFTVYGSIELDRAALEIQHRFDFRRFKTIVAPLRPDFTVRLSATMKRYAVSNGPTYAAALALLFREWDADEQHGGRPSPLSSRRQIGSG